MTTLIVITAGESHVFFEMRAHVLSHLVMPIGPSRFAEAQKSQALSSK